MSTPYNSADRPPTRMVRAAGALIVMGLLVTAYYLLFPTPLTLTIFFFFGQAPVMLGFVLYVIHVLGELRRSGQL